MQPSTTASEDIVHYSELSPAAVLQDFVYCYWQLKTDAPLQSPYNYRVVSDGCIDIFFDNSDVSDSLIMGFCKKYTTFPLATSFDYIGVRFYPSIFPLLFKVPASELANKTTRVVDVLPELASSFHRHLRANQTLEVIQDDLNFVLESYTQKVSLNIDHRFYDSLNIIMENLGSVEIESELKTGLSPRQLRRIFNYYIGATPKAFSRVVRFQHVLNAKPSGASLKNNKLFYDAGFYDQAHFIKEFKNFYGVTPIQAFG